MQQIIALIVVALMAGRLFWQKRKNAIGRNEFLFWLMFWLLSGMAVAFLKEIDALVARLGFSGAGIDILFYLGVVFLFYLVAKVRIKQERTDREITRIVRHISLDEVNKEKP